MYIILSSINFWKRFNMTYYRLHSVGKMRIPFCLLHYECLTRNLTICSNRIYRYYHIIIIDHVSPWKNIKYILFRIKTNTDDGYNMIPATICSSSFMRLFAAAREALLWNRSWRESWFISMIYDDASQDSAGFCLSCRTRAPLSFIFIFFP